MILIILGEEYNSLSSSLRCFLLPPVTSTLNGQNILSEVYYTWKLPYSGIYHRLDF
jgi:hypothetical protein